MSSFAMFLLERGVDVELVLDIAGMPTFLSEESARYSCGEYIYKVNVGKGVLGKHWDLVVNAMDPNMEGQPLFPLGRMEIEPVGDGMSHIKIPPRIEQSVLGDDAADWDGKLFASFVSQLLNSLYSRGMIELPGVLPTA